MDSLFVYPVLFLAALIAGWIDSIAGGGGLITLPALLAAGLPPHLALGTNKLQSTFGSFTATANNYRRGIIKLGGAVWGIVCTAIGAALGAYVVQILESEFLERIIPFLLFAILVYFVFSPRLSDHDKSAKIPSRIFYFVCGLALGFYDGFFGPGTGSFWVFLFVSMLGYNLTRATGYTKLMNFTSNIISLIAFTFGGNISIKVGLIMGAGQMIGAYVGSHMAIRNGARFIRPVLVVVVFATTVKLFIDYFK
ncbi:MAG: TSUP family transporter [Candidatus Zixiibacteriota bacterium]